MKKINYVEISIFNKKLLDFKEKIAKLTNNSPEIKKIKIETIPPNEEFTEEIYVVKLKIEETGEEFIKELLKKVKISDENVDEKANLYIRLNKQKFFEDNIYELTSSGDCIHIKANLSAHPAKKEKGIELLKEL
jgi:RNA binding exosome subunit